MSGLSWVVAPQVGFVESWVVGVGLWMEIRDSKVGDLSFLGKTILSLSLGIWVQDQIQKDDGFLRWKQGV